MALSDDQIKTDKQLAAAGFSAQAVALYDRARKAYAEVQAQLALVLAVKDWKAIVELEERAENIERVLTYHGRNPKSIPVAELKDLIRTESSGDPIIKKYRNRVRHPNSAVRAFCVRCMGGDTAAVRECTGIGCVLWPFRMGGNPFFGKALPPVDPEELILEDDDDVPVEEESPDEADDND